MIMSEHRVVSNYLNGLFFTHTYTIQIEIQY
ncbi:Uncharacterised protein [Legionella taurinensis]|nr:Uncharacterised protein [Legionella taurinensis]